jgi:putative MATE family efflux protein
MRKQQMSLTEGKIFPTLLEFAIPFLLASLLQALYGATDLFVVGRFGDTAGASAVAVGSQVMQTITGIVLGLATGGTVLIGQYWGAKRNRDIAQTIGTIIWVFSIIAVGLTIAMTLSTGMIATLMRTPKEAVAYARQYIFICSCGIVFIVGYNVVSGVLRGLGDSRTPLLFVAVACAVNMVLDVVLVRTFHMGAAGAALATVFSQAVSLVLSILFLKRRGFAFEVSRGDIRPDRSRAANILKLGLPIALQDGLINISFLLITVITNTMGLVVSAAVGVVEKIIIFAMLPSMAFSSAIAVMTAQNVGAGKRIRAEKSMYAGIGCSLVFGIAFCLSAQVNGASLSSLFSTDAAVIRTAALYLRSYSIDCILVCFIFCLNAFFSGCGHTLFPLLHSLVSTFLVRVPMSLLLSRIPGMTLYDIGFASPSATLLSIVMCAFYMKSGRWKTNQIIGGTDAAG